MAMELRKMSIDYERRRMQLQVYYGNFPILCIGLFAVVPIFPPSLFQTTLLLLSYYCYSYMIRLEDVRLIGSSLGVIMLPTGCLCLLYTSDAADE